MSAVQTAIEATNESTGNSTWKDSMGIIASVGCAIHCAAMPFVIAYLPAWGLSFLADEAFHKWMALICFLIAIAAFVPGIRKHGNWIPISVGAVGLVFITFAAFGLAGECCPSCANANTSAAANATGDELSCQECENCEHCQGEADKNVTQASHSITADETQKKKDWLSVLAPWITPFGGCLLVVAHLMNRRFGSHCGCCKSDGDKETCESA